MTESDQKEKKWQAFVDSAFKAAKLPEVSPDMLEAGTYTNAQIAEKFRDNPFGLMVLLMKSSELGGEAERRSIISFAVDIMETDK